MQLFTLTTGTDAITGTSGNDTITAGALAPDGVTAAATLNALDTIDGGAGVDTLVIDATGNKNAVTGTINSTFSDFYGMFDYNKFLLNIK